MSDLSTRDFAAYFEAVHGVAPFPWQRRLLDEVVRAGRWPELLDLPTGVGKTAAIDVALFHLALDAAAAPRERKAPRRIVMVVDRRTVVDQAFERARTIAAAIESATSGVLQSVGARLRSVGGDAPLAVAELRGGMPKSDAWAQRPDQPLVAISTVDQVGSRLLFRGYGVSPRMRPVHAGLLGADTLLLLDEVHLARPFLATLQDVARYREWAERPLDARFQVVSMSATPGTGVDARFTLDADDRRDATLAKRLAAKKPVECKEVKVGGDEAHKLAELARACADHAMALAQTGRVVGVVVNRVASATATFEALRSRVGDRAEVFLVTGRMRPLDRDDLDRELASRVRSGRDRNPEARPVVVVSTQCIEAGADFDFDALVTECASFDALKQRFGRLNRIGAIDDARAVVLVRSDALGKEADDPIYGGALAETWRWLARHPSVDFGIDGLPAPGPDELSNLLVTPTRAPVLLPAHLDAWVQTAPEPRPDPDVSLFLHGIGRRVPADVHVVWRAEVTEELLVAGAEEDLATRVAACPPVSLEAVSVPVWAVSAWLRGAPAASFGDVEGEAEREPGQERREHQAGRPAFLWDGESGTILHADDLGPGATIVVPTSYGGLADGTWNPSSKVPVRDLGDRARFRQTGRPTLRLHASLIASLGLPAVPAITGVDSDEDDRAIIDRWLDSTRELVASERWVDEALGLLRLRGRRRPTIVRIADAESTATTSPIEGSNGYFVLLGRASLRAGSDFSSEDDGASHTGVEVTLRHHLAGVAAKARELAERSGLPEEVAHDVVLAARWHDAGKVDPRFQQLLHGGSAFRAESAPEPLAKSSIVASDRAARMRARERSRYPKGARHELSSVALITAHEPILAAAHDRDLVLHLVASHHGHCRPFAPVAFDPEPVELRLEMDGSIVNASSNHGLARLDSGIAERFWRLVRRYGWHGLAWLESIVRLADHRRSEEEQRGEGIDEVTR